MTYVELYLSEIPATLVKKKLYGWAILSFPSTVVGSWQGVRDLFLTLQSEVGECVFTLEVDGTSDESLNNDDLDSDLTFDLVGDLDLSCEDDGVSTLTFELDGDLDLIFEDDCDSSLIFLEAGELVSSEIFTIMNYI